MRNFISNYFIFIFMNPSRVVKKNFILVTKLIFTTRKPAAADYQISEGRISKVQLSTNPSF